MSQTHLSDDHDPPDEGGPEPSSQPRRDPGLDPVPLPRSPAHGRRLARPQQAAPTFSFEQRLLLLDIWRRSGLPAGDFAPLVGLSKYTLYEWKRRFEADGPAGLADRPRGGPLGSRLSEVTRRTIVMLKQSNPDW